MTKLEKHQTKWSDTVKMKITTNKKISLDTLKKLSIEAEYRTVILEGSVNGNKATLYLSASAYHAGEQNVFTSTENLI